MEVVVTAAIGVTVIRRLKSPTLRVRAVYFLPRSYYNREDAPFRPSKPSLVHLRPGFVCPMFQQNPTYA